MNELVKEKKKKTQSKTVVEAHGIKKSFKLYHDRPSSLKEAVIGGLKRKKYSTFWALNDVSFKVKQGTTFGIIGENGSGKSTLLKILTGVYKPTSGTAYVEGKISGLLELGAGFHPDLTGRENIYLNASILGMSKKQVDGILDEIIAFSEIEDFIDTPVKHYSSGMFVRLGFAVAINIDPDVLVIDEVLAVGDEHFQRKCNEKIVEFKKQKKTIIIVSHALEELRTLCDEAIWLERGVVKECGPVENVIDSYLRQVNLQEAELAEGKALKIGKYGSRWGSGEAIISKVEFFGSDGKKRRLFKTGEELIAKISYEAKRRIEKPVFGFAVHTDKGLHLTGPNTRIAGKSIDFIEGEGQVEYHIKELPFLKGKYLCSAAIYDYSCRHPYDHQEEMHPFEIIDGPIKEGYGVVHMPAIWRAD